MAVKSRSAETAELETLDLAKCLIYLSHSLNSVNSNSKPTHSDAFECKTCNRKFSSFQALGGHRASHRRPKNFLGLGLHAFKLASTKPKMHECSVCGVEFALGQALGGHMRRHRAAATMTTESFGSVPVVVAAPPPPPPAPVLRRSSSSSKRVFGVDLNLTPLQNDLEYLFAKMAPQVSII